MEGGASGLGQSSALPPSDTLDQSHHSTQAEGNEDNNVSYSDFSENGAGTQSNARIPLLTVEMVYPDY